MFLHTNDRIINLKNVSNINILKDKNRIVFNLNYNIEIITDFEGYGKFISDYVYWDAISSDNLRQNVEHLEENQYFKDNFLPEFHNNGYININEISSIKFSEKKHRVIFNLSHPITFKDYDGNERITSEFVYVNCQDFKKYKEYVEFVKSTLSDKYQFE